MYNHTLAVTVTIAVHHVVMYVTALIEKFI